MSRLIFSLNADKFILYVVATNSLYLKEVDLKEQKTLKNTDIWKNVNDKCTENKEIVHRKFVDQ